MAGVVGEYRLHIVDGDFISAPLVEQRVRACLAVERLTIELVCVRLVDLEKIGVDAVVGVDHHAVWVGVHHPERIWGGLDVGRALRCNQAKIAGASACAALDSRDCAIQIGGFVDASHREVPRQAGRLVRASAAAGKCVHCDADAGF